MSSELLRIDEKWSVEYDPSNNDKPGRTLRYGEPVFGGSSDWKNDTLAMFYALIDRDARIEALEAENARLRRCVDDQIQAELRASQEVMRVQAADDWYYEGRPIVEIANEAIGFERALEVIAGSHWERVGYCQSDVEDIPNLTAIEAQSHARATLQKFRAARRAREGGNADG